MVYSQAKHAFVLKHYVVLKSSAAVCEAFSKTYPNEEVPDKTTIHQLVTKFWDTGSACNRKCGWCQITMIGNKLSNT
jgi:hypothetical protein